MPSVQSLAFFNEIGPLVAGLLLAGRVGAGISAELANMRATEQIDAIEALSVDSFKMLVVPRIIACAAALPLLTVFMDFAGLVGGYVAERFIPSMSPGLYLLSRLSRGELGNFCSAHCEDCGLRNHSRFDLPCLGYTTNEGADGVGRAATNSVVASSVAIILADVIFFKKRGFSRSRARNLSIWNEPIWFANIWKRTFTCCIAT
jgi:phospholipid/cholesterol/gamma-HCH transport system permease protein